MVARRLRCTASIFLHWELELVDECHSTPSKRHYVFIWTKPMICYIVALVLNYNRCTRNCTPQEVTVRRHKRVAFYLVWASMTSCRCVVMTLHRGTGIPISHLRLTQFGNRLFILRPLYCSDGGIPLMWSLLYRGCLDFLRSRPRSTSPEVGAWGFPSRVRYSWSQRF